MPKKLIIIGICLVLILVIGMVVFISNKPKGAKYRADTSEFVLADFNEKMFLERGQKLKIREKDIVFEANDQVWDMLESIKEQYEEDAKKGGFVSYGYELIFTYTLTVNGVKEDGEIVDNHYSSVKATKETSYEVDLSYNYEGKLIVTIKR